MATDWRRTTSQPIHCTGRLSCRPARQIVHIAGAVLVYVCSKIELHDTLLFFNAAHLTSLLSLTEHA